jgi:3D (Asp-Asp-Asp) domain-containing protein
MRYITDTTVRFFIYFIFLASLVGFAYDCVTQHNLQQSAESTITQLQNNNAALQADNATLRAELDRMKQEASRGSNRRMMEISYYTDDPDENGGYDGLTSSGTQLTVGRTVAANNLPFGTRVFIQGIGWRVVEDRGNLKDNQIDVLVESKEVAYENGRHMAAVVVER